MFLAGIQKLSLLDYPGMVACTLFTPGCNFRCPWCHNASLVLPDQLPREGLDPDEVLNYLKKRKGVLDGVGITGGEPLLQLDEPLIAMMHQHGFDVAVETNGTLPVPQGVDWVCVSPKMGAKLVVTKGDELKVVVPQAGQDLKAYERLDFTHHYLQPMDGENAQQNVKIAVETCLKHPQWKLSLQTHKYLQIP